MALRVTDEELQLEGVPEGLVARPLRQHRAGPDGEIVEVRTRRGQTKLERVELAPPSDDVLAAATLEAGEERWILDAGERRWSAIAGRYKQRALERAVALAHAGVVRLRCRVDERLAVELPPTGWVLTDTWQERRADEDALRKLEREQWRTRADHAAARVVGICAPLAEALRAAAAGNPTLPVLVYAAEDLVEGATHAGPRAFSQAHFGLTKARDDVADILRAAGVDDDTLIRLGVRRSARIGLAGAVEAHVGGRVTALEGLDGPVLLRADQRGLRVRLTRPASVVIVENLQAAETLADQIEDIAIVYTAGVPSEAALTLISQLATTATRVLLVPDADLGGVRISERVLRAAPGAKLVDIGEYPHPPAEPWPEDGVSVRGLKAAIDGPAGALAHACLGRGYPVEQELATMEAVHALRGSARA